MGRVGRAMSFPDLENPYICPLCRRGFPRAAIDEKTLTFEDAPPKSYGGKPVALTCRDCNNSLGNYLDASLSALDSGPMSPCKISLDAPLLREPATGYEITLREIGGSQVGKLQLKNSEKQAVKIELKFSQRAWTVDLRDGPKYVGLLGVVVTYTYQEKPVSPLSLRQYDGAGTGTIMEVVQGDAAISDRERMRVYTFVKRGGEEQN